MKRQMLAAAMLCMMATMACAADKETGETIYRDDSGTTSATVSQALPGGGGHTTTTQMLLTNVTRVSITQETYVVEWGGGAVTILPRQFVSSITLNKRAAATQASTRPAER